MADGRRLDSGWGVTRSTRDGERPSPPLQTPAFSALKQRIIARTGHHYYTDKDAQLWERIASRMEARGIGAVEDYLALLDGDGAGAAEWAALESAVTINETFFFRFAEQFDALRRSVLPRLIRARAGEKRLRIWSVGCSTGAEPYSIAILLHELLGDALPQWRIGILGTDIDRNAISLARDARYTSWTLRTLGEGERARLFDREGGLYRLKPHYRGMVRFERHNLLSLVEGEAPLQFEDYDLIFCRNVLIYFRQDVATRVVGALVERLAPQGYLFVGHAEATPGLDARVATIDAGGVLAFRRHGEAGADEVPPLPRALPALPAPARGGRRATPPAKPARRSPRPQPAPAKAPPGASLADVRAALTRGDVARAGRLAAAESAAAPRDPVPHYLAALGAWSLGDALRAEQGFRKALYLDNGFAMAHYLLGRHLMARGRTVEGRRSLANALRAAAALDPGAELLEGDGLTAAELAGAVRHALGSGA